MCKIKNEIVGKKEKREKVGKNLIHLFFSCLSLKIVNTGRYSARILISCICDKRPFPIHPNEVVTRESTAPLITRAEQVYPGVCMMTLRPENPEMEITNIGIQTDDRKKIFEKLAFKMTEGIDPFGGKK